MGPPHKRRPMGRRMSKAWPTIYNILGPLMKQTRTSGLGRMHTNTFISIARSGYLSPLSSLSLSLSLSLLSLSSLSLRYLVRLTTAMLIYDNTTRHKQECYFSISCAPIFDEDGSVGGVWSILVETTHKVLHDRRMEVLNELGHASQGASTVSEVYIDIYSAVARAIQKRGREKRVT